MDIPGAALDGDNADGVWAAFSDERADKPVIVLVMSCADGSGMVVVVVVIEPDKLGVPNGIEGEKRQ